MFSVVSLHDVAPSTFEQSSTLLGWAEERGLPTSLLVVPGPWNGPGLRPGTEFGSWLRAAERRGHEVVVHGWEHREVPTPDVPAHRRLRARTIGRGAGEFAHLGQAEARRRAAAGLRILHAMGCAPRGFVPPAWLLSEDAMWGLRDVGFEYTTTRSSVIDLRHSERLQVPAYCQRPHSRLTAAGSVVVDTLVARRIRRGRPVRIALHPADVDTAGLRTATHRLLDRAATAPAFTYTDLLARTRRPDLSEAADDTPTGLDLRSV